MVLLWSLTYQFYDWVYFKPIHFNGAMCFSELGFADCTIVISSVIIFQNMLNLKEILNLYHLRSCKCNTYAYKLCTILKLGYIIQ